MRVVVLIGEIFYSYLPAGHSILRKFIILIN
jgi:hypothetical protein